MILRVMKINGRRTSVRLERGFWDALDDVARRRGLDAVALVSQIDGARGGSSLSRALRVTAVAHFRELLHRTAETVSMYGEDHHHGLNQDNRLPTSRRQVQQLVE